MSSRPLVEQWSERSGVVCIAAWALPCVRSPSWKMNNDIRLSSSHPVVPFKTLMLERSVCVCCRPLHPHRGHSWVLTPTPPPPPTPLKTSGGFGPIQNQKQQKVAKIIKKSRSFSDSAGLNQDYEITNREENFGNTFHSKPEAPTGSTDQEFWANTKPKVTTSICRFEFQIPLLLGFGPLRSGPVRSGPVRSGPVRSGPVRSGPVRSGPVRSGPVRSGPVRSAPVRSGLVSS